MSLEKAGKQVTVFQAEPEPTVEKALTGVEKAREGNCDFIIGIGGGSVIDTGKAISALLTNPGDPFEYLEVIGKGTPIPNQAAPYVAIPTTAGTGAEVTRNAVLGSPSHRVKVSLRSSKMLPAVAIVDPELTYSLPASVTASTGLDALTQVIEAFLSKKATPFTDALCREGISRASRSLKRAYENGDDVDARTDMAITSLFSGLALANAGLGAVHGLAGPLGGLIGAPHGEICAALLPHVLRANLRVLRETEHAQEVLSRFDELALILTGRDGAQAGDAVRWVEGIAEELQVQPLSTLGLKHEDLIMTADKAARASSMKGNPVGLSSEELQDILKSAS
jgi:alcohol dehydrogenase class IV